MTERTPVEAPTAPAAIGPYSHAVLHGDVLYCSGQIPLDPRTGRLVADSVEAETEQCLRNLSAFAEAAGTDLSRALRMTIFTTDLSAFGMINEAYERFLAHSVPARVTVGVAALPLDARVEIDAVVAAG